ncbi:hypothetical protein GY45DRAFT_1316374 [Cubamyces sp. BRFM 1775]|nr:hypothetical protein GY45DRAFT_1316374 [Cubamyces sp. BRFM 1775]
MLWFLYFATMWLLLSSYVGWASNVTSIVDDTSMDPVTGHRIQYTPANAWRAVSSGNCTDCVAHPGYLIAYEETWHESDLPASSQDVTPKATFPFFGESVMVYCIVQYYGPDPRAASFMQFVLDGEYTSQYIMLPTIKDKATYVSTPVYVNTSLPGGNHTLEIINGIPGHSSPSVLLLDYIVYSLLSSELPSTFTLPTVTTAYPYSGSNPSTINPGNLTLTGGATSTSSNSNSTSPTRTRAPSGAASDFGRLVDGVFGVNPAVLLCGVVFVTSLMLETSCSYVL